MKWYEDPELLASLPLRYRAYAAYSSLFGSAGSRRVAGGSFLLRMLSHASDLAGSTTIGKVRGIGGLTVVTDFADERVLEVIHEIRGENPEYQILRDILFEGALFVDVGANFGTFSLLGSRLVGASGKVIAIEPQTTLALLIEESLLLSGADNCDVERVACGNKEDEKLLLVPNRDSGRAGFFDRFSGRPSHKSEKVVVTTLDALLASHHPRGGSTLIKIDVEGSEIDVLDGALQTIERLSPAILIEMNPWSAAAAGHRPSEIVDRLTSLGYTSFATAESYPKTVDPRGLPRDKQINVVARR